MKNEKLEWNRNASLTRAEAGTDRYMDQGSQVSKPRWVREMGVLSKYTRYGASKLVV